VRGGGLKFPRGEPTTGIKRGERGLGEIMGGKELQEESLRASEFIKWPKQVRKGL